jgi:hypothetical protein
MKILITLFFFSLYTSLAGPTFAQQPGDDPFSDKPQKIFEYSKENPTGGNLVTDTVSSQVDFIQKVVHRNLSRYFLKEIMMEKGIPIMALIMDTRLNHESFYMINSYLGKYIIEKILKSGVMLKDEKNKELFILKINSSKMEPLEDETSAVLSETAIETPETELTPFNDNVNSNTPPKSNETAADNTIDDELLFGNLSKDEFETRKKVRSLRQLRRAVSPIENQNTGTDTSNKSTPENPKTNK